MFIKVLRGLLPAAALLTATACESLGPSDSHAVSVSFAGRAAAATSNGSPSFAQIPITDGTHTIDLQNVDVIFDDIVLERSDNDLDDRDDADSESDSDNDGDLDSDGDSDTDSDGDSESGHDEDVRRGPFTVALPLTGGVITPINETLPAGLYQQVEMEVAFVRLQGTYDGQPFDVTLPVHEDFKIEFEPPLLLDDDADRVNITIAIDFTNWLRNSAGLVDPRLLSTNSQLRAEVIDRIERSFKAFEDSDKDADDADSDSDSR
ncbi:MAG TPA: hypothetical protein VGD27_14090 [Longimicrobiales bacterium]